MVDDKGAQKISIGGDSVINDNEEDDALLIVLLDSKKRNISASNNDSSNDDGLANKMWKGLDHLVHSMPIYGCFLHLTSTDGEDADISKPGTSMEACSIPSSTYGIKDDISKIDSIVWLLPSHSLSIEGQMTTL